MPFTKISLKWILDLNSKQKTINSPEEHIEENLHDLDFDKFIDTT
jgi:hypothetical protein